VNELDKWFEPQPLNRGLIRQALRGATDVIIHRDGRVMAHKRGQRVDLPLHPIVQAEVRRALSEGVLMDLLPRVGRNSANLRVRG